MCFYLSVDVVKIKPNAVVLRSSLFWLFSHNKC
eukprot:SAG11_NODE_2299_length_3552_cov_1.788300_2_plen_33_part_00